MNRNKKGLVKPIWR